LGHQTADNIFLFEQGKIDGTLERDPSHPTNKLARAISDVGFGMFRAQMEYKAKRYGPRFVIADRGSRRGRKRTGRTFVRVFDLILDFQHFLEPV
jgi:transposase